MNRQVKCRLCGELIDKELAYQDKERKSFYFCNNEHFIEYGQKHAEKVAKSKNPPKTQGESQTYKELIDYVYFLYDKKIPPFVFKQIKELTTREHRPLTYKGIELSLRYWVDTTEHLFDKDTGIGIVEYVYDEAERFWRDRQRIKKASANYTQDKTISQGTQSVNINALKYKLRKEGSSND